jgi:hypothetical protein
LTGCCPKLALVAMLNWHRISFFGIRSLIVPERSSNGIPPRREHRSGKPFTNGSQDSSSIHVCLSGEILNIVPFTSTIKFDGFVKSQEIPLSRLRGWEGTNYSPSPQPSPIEGEGGFWTFYEFVKFDLIPKKDILCRPGNQHKIWATAR